MTPPVLNWAARLCSRNDTGAMSVYYLMQAWSMATFMAARKMTLSEQDIMLLATTVAPAGISREGYRIETLDTDTVPHQKVARKMADLLTKASGLTAQEFYDRFMEVRPFESHNEVVGDLLYNLHAGTLDNPSRARLTTT